jgi:hypothetical protein
VSNMHEGMNDCTHLLSYLNTVKCCCGVCWGSSIDMFWECTLLDSEEPWIIVLALDLNVI